MDFVCVFCLPRRNIIMDYGFSLYKTNLLTGVLWIIVIFLNLFIYFYQLFGLSF